MPNDFFGVPQSQSTAIPQASRPIPLAERMRPTTLADVFGQPHLTGERGPLAQMIRSRKPQSIIFWGPPGCGKTTLARLFSDLFDLRFVAMSAIHSGVADFKKAFDEARRTIQTGGRPTLLLVDEIHRLNKNQQDTFLPAVEDGTIVLIGATTENPSFEVNGALLSRARVLTLRPLEASALEAVLARAEAATHQLPITAEARAALIHDAGGDARRLLNQVELLQTIPPDAPLDVAEMEDLLSRRLASHDKAGDAHYDLASAFQKSCRGSDVDAALLYGARMVMAGDVAMLIRRLLVIASEDVGLADSQAFLIASAARDAYHHLGMPEAGYAIAQAIIYVATAPKSNAAHNAWGAVTAFIQKNPDFQPPKRIRNAPTKLMKAEGYKEGYQYDHDHPNAFSGQDFWPDGMAPQTFYEPTPRGFEPRIKERLDRWNTIRKEVRSAGAPSRSASGTLPR